jgi:hypothetical protein
MDRYKAALVATVVASLAVMAAVLALAPKQAPERKGPAAITMEIDFGGQGPGKDSNTTKWFTRDSDGKGDNTSEYLIVYLKKNNMTDWIIDLWIDNGTVYSALGKAASELNFTFGSEWYPNFRAHRVTEIAGVKDGTDGRYWQYYVNGVYMGTGADLAGLKDGDVVRWEFRSALQ